MNGTLHLLLAGFTAGILAAAMAFVADFSWLAAFGFYVLGGNIGLLFTAMLMARARSDTDIEAHTIEAYSAKACTEEG
ncbi:hypothetical protein [Jannaschia sp. CCS1]|uniref:hypothetical protein n=1 Tax=Jannaschia sp. (strain CCS1) TaxID=290400 RepID=UPI0002E78E20|nr:hypothetical protein [Jannaschia sp. CCS1]